MRAALRHLIATIAARAGLTCGAHRGAHRQIAKAGA